MFSHQSGNILRYKTGWLPLKTERKKASKWQSLCINKSGCVAGVLKTKNARHWDEPLRSRQYCTFEPGNSHWFSGILSNLHHCYHRSHYGRWRLLHPNGQCRSLCLFVWLGQPAPTLCELKELQIRRPCISADGWKKPRGPNCNLHFERPHDLVVHCTLQPSWWLSGSLSTITYTTSERMLEILSDICNLAFSLTVSGNLYDIDSDMSCSIIWHY